MSKVGNTKRVAGSWSHADIEAGATLVRALLMGADVRVMARSESFKRFAHHMLRLEMRARTGEKSTRGRGEQFISRSHSARMIVEALRRAYPQSLSRAELATHIDRSDHRTRDLLREALRLGHVEKTGGCLSETRWRATSPIARLA